MSAIGGQRMRDTAVDGFAPTDIHDITEMTSLDE
jgi:hypothetical protein